MGEDSNHIIRIVIIIILFLLNFWIAWSVILISGMCSI